LKLKPPADNKLYFTKDYPHYRDFVSKQSATARANGWTEEEKVLSTVLYLNGSLRELWEDYAERESCETNWSKLCEFLEEKLGDPKNRRIDAWSRAVSAKPKQDEDDNAYLYRFRELRREIGDEAWDLEKVWLHLYHASFPKAIQAKVREQENFPNDLYEYNSLLARIRPTIASSQSYSQGRGN
jgi:hypothetical protein